MAVGASSSSPRLQAEQHLEGGTAYRQVRPTRLDGIVGTWSQPAAARGVLWSWLTTVDHTPIGVLYGVTVTSEDGSRRRV